MLRAYILFLAIPLLLSNGSALAKAAKSSPVTTSAPSIVDYTKSGDPAECSHQGGSDDSTEANCTKQYSGYSACALNQTSGSFVEQSQQVAAQSANTNLGDTANKVKGVKGTN